MFIQTNDSKVKFKTQSIRDIDSFPSVCVNFLSNIALFLISQKMDRENKKLSRSTDKNRLEADAR